MVVVGGDHSEWVPVRSGVPQGMVLGPLLFLLFTNDLPENLSSQVRLFADDCVVYREIVNDYDAKMLQKDLDTLSNWEKTWQMRFNADNALFLKSLIPINMFSTIVTSWGYNITGNKFSSIPWSGNNQRSQVENTCKPNIS